MIVLVIATMLGFAGCGGESVEDRANALRAARKVTLDRHHGHLDRAAVAPADGRTDRHGAEVLTAPAVTRVPWLSARGQP